MLKSAGVDFLGKHVFFTSRNNVSAVFQTSLFRPEAGRAGLLRSCFRLEKSRLIVWSPHPLNGLLLNDSPLLLWGRENASPLKYSSERCYYSPSNFGGKEKQNHRFYRGNQQVLPPNKMVEKASPPLLGGRFWVKNFLPLNILAFWNFRGEGVPRQISIGGKDVLWGGSFFDISPPIWPVLWEVPKNRK